jgi:putative tryptophan/tyrosine transport system substrate-binding protein
MRRRDFIAGFGSTAALPVVARAQQREGNRRIGVLMGWEENDPLAKAGLSSFARGLDALGWNDHNLQIEIRWGAGNVDRMRMFAKELVDLNPDAILSNTTPVTAALKTRARTTPIVFVIVSDPIGAGFVASLARPEGNITGFVNVEATMGGKWLQLLTEIAPAVKRAAIMFNPETAAGGGSYFLTSFESAAQLLKVEPIVMPVRSDAEIELVITSLSREPGCGLVVMTDGFMQVHRAPIISLAARNSVPAVYAEAVSVRDGGLLSYGADYVDIFRRAAP